MKEIVLPVENDSALVSEVLHAFGITVVIQHSDTDSDSSFNDKKFIINREVSRESVGNDLRSGDLLVYVDGKPVADMWMKKVSGTVRLTFEEVERRSKRKPKKKKDRAPAPTHVIAMMESSQMESPDRILFLNPENDKTKKMARSAGAILTIGDIITRINLTHDSTSKSSETSSGTENDDNSRSCFPPVTLLNSSFGIAYYASFFRSGNRTVYLWLSAAHYSERDCQITAKSLRDFCNFLYLPGHLDPGYLEGFCDNLSDPEQAGRNWPFQYKDHGFSLPVEIHVDIDAALAEIDAVEFDSISTSDHFYPRRKYFVIGSCCFLNNLLVRSHASRVEQRLISIAQSIVRLDRDEIFCHEVFLDNRAKTSQIVGYEQPEGRSYALVMVKHDTNVPGLPTVTICALLESFYPIDKASTTPKVVDPIITRRCRQIAKVIARNERLFNWINSPDYLYATKDRLHEKAAPNSLFSKFTKPAAAPSEAGSYKSGSTTASMLGPLNAGELHTHFDAQTKVEPESNTQIVAGPFGISYFTCFVDSGVILQPKTVGMNVSQELLANFRSTIEHFRPQLEKPSHSDEELGALINAGFKKGSGLMQYWVLGRKIDKKALFICINAQVPQFMNEICFKFAFGLLL